MNYRYYFVIFWTAALLTGAAASAKIYAQGGAATPPPVAPVREVTDEYFGQKIVDPYRWMENGRGAELSEWMKAQNDHARRFLDGSPLREKFRRELAAQNNAVTNVSGIRRVGERYFYFKLAPGDADRRVFVRDGLTGAERALVDPQKISEAAGGKRFSIISFSPSPDGKKVAFLVAAGGAELGEIRVVETETGKFLDDRIEPARWYAGAWLPDSTGFLYIRFTNENADAPPTERFQKRKVYLHRIGDAREADRAVFGHEVSEKVALDPKLLPFPFVPSDSKYAFVAVNTGVSPNSELYVAPVESLSEKQIPWRKAIAFEDEVRLTDFSDTAESFVVSGDDLYLLTYKNAPRYKVVKTSLRNPDLKNAKTVLGMSDAITTTLVAARDALYVRRSEGASGQILRVDYRTGKAENLRLPYDGTIFNLTSDVRADGVIFAIDSWVRPKTVFAFDPKGKKIGDTKLQPPASVDVSKFESTQVKVKSHDGTMVPLSIIYKKGIERDGRNVVGLSGYGAYGITHEPRFSPSFFPFLEAGGIIAFAHVRGGGEYGEEWHQAGYKATKPNTWKDFIACAEYLIRERYTSPERLAAHGASAGGILIGNAIAERPDLFGAAVIEVGLNNMLRYETTANGVPNVAEFGSVKTEQGFRDLLAMDAYHKIKPGVKYPSVLLTHGINDPRVEPWLSAKMAARLQASTTSGNPVLLRIDYDAGHGIGNSRQQFIDGFADIYAFVFESLSGGKEISRAGGK